MIAGRILAARNARKAGPDLSAADASIGQARSAMAGHDYNATWRAARSAYESVLQGADRAGVDVTPSYNGWAVLPKVTARTRRPTSARAATRRQARGPAAA